MCNESTTKGEQEWVERLDNKPEVGRKRPGTKEGKDNKKGEGMSGITQWRNLVGRNLAEKHKEWIEKWRKFTTRESRINWNEYFLLLAYITSLRSPDAETKCGCIIATKENRIISFGYNGFPHQLEDGFIPNNRPHKYLWVIHAEENAIFNTSYPLEGCVAYVTLKPCLRCLKSLYQNGIDKIVYINQQSKLTSEFEGTEEEAVYDIFVKMSEISMVPLDINIKELLQRCIIL